MGAAAFDRDVPTGAGLAWPRPDGLRFRRAEGLLAGLTGCTPERAARALLRTAVELGLDGDDLADRFLTEMADDHPVGLLAHLVGVALAPDEGRAARGALSRVLETAEGLSPVSAVEAVTRELRAELGAAAVSFLIEDLSGRGLVRLTHGTGAGEPSRGGRPGDDIGPGERRDAAESATVLTFDGGPAEQALRTQTVRVLPPDPLRGEPPAGRWGVLAPVTERGETLGLLELSLPVEPSAEALSEITRAAHVLAFVVIANRRHTDLFEWGQRSTPLTLPAEIQRRLLPAAFTCEAGAFTLSAWLEPAAAIAGDTFDYSVDRDVLHLSVTDAMGHGIASALTATLCVGSLRNTRRAGGALLDQAAAANAALVENAARSGDEGFVTGLLGRLDLPTGVMALVNAGHVAPYLARDGAVTRIEVPPDLPLGLFPDTVYRSTELVLEPGDRFVVVTDGMLERAAAGLDLTAAIIRTRSLHPREATRRLADDVLDLTGSALADDATLLVLDWHGHHGHHGRDRDTAAGADRGRASSHTLADGADPGFADRFLPERDHDHSAGDRPDAYDAYDDRARAAQARERAAADRDRATTDRQKAVGTDDLEREVAGLRDALASRLVIGQAEGLLMARHGLPSPDAAFAVLARLSQQGNTKLRDVAAHIVADATVQAGDEA